MFKNIGMKIMSLAEILCWIGIFFSIGAGIVAIWFGFKSENVFLFICGIAGAILGPIVSWVNAFVLYGFGRLIDNSDIIAGRK